MESITKRWFNNSILSEEITIIIESVYFWMAKKVSLLDRVSKNTSRKLCKAIQRMVVDMKRVQIQQK